MVTETEQTPVDDLEDFNDEYMHAACKICYPVGSLKFLDTYIGFCGQKAVVSRMGESAKDFFIEPPDACPRCLLRMTCAVCGNPA